MAVVWMTVAGLLLAVLVGFLSFVTGVGLAMKRKKDELLKELGVTRENVKIYGDAMKFLADLTQHAALNDALAPIGEQTLLSDENKRRASELLARHKKEIS